MKKSLDYWRNFWDNCETEHLTHYGKKHEISAWKSIEMLADYAKFFKGPICWGGTFMRLITGHWNRHHAEKIEKAIGNFYHFDGYYALSPEFHSTYFVLACVITEVSNSEIDPDGDLAKILQVITEKTSVSIPSPEEAKDIQEAFRSVERVFNNGVVTGTNRSLLIDIMTKSINFCRAILMLKNAKILTLENLFYKLNPIFNQDMEDGFMKEFNGYLQEEEKESNLNQIRFDEMTASFINQIPRTQTNISLYRLPQRDDSHDEEDTKSLTLVI